MRPFIIAMWIVCLTVSSKGDFTLITDDPVAQDSGWCYGLIWGDFNNDDYDDLFVINNDTIASKRSNLFYINNQDGTFTKVTEGVIVEDTNCSYGCTAADYDNDGDLDLFIGNEGYPGEPDLLYQNNGDGTFTKIITIAAIIEKNCTFSCNWVDYDMDGKVDLFINLFNKDNILLHNLGNDQLSKIYDIPFLAEPSSQATCAWADYDNDGDPDFFINLRDLTCQLFINSGNGVFIKENEHLDLIDSTGWGCGVSWGDCNNDGFLDLFVPTGALGTYYNYFYINNGNGSFTSIKESPLVEAIDWASGSAWGDFDNDGDLDLFLVRYDHAIDNVNPDRLFINKGDGNFEIYSSSVIDSLQSYGRACAWSDYDRDGDLDIFIARNNFHGGYRNSLLRNDLINENNWIEIKLVGVKSNASAIGARVTVIATINGKRVMQIREVSSTTGGYLTAQNSLVVHFGLGDALSVDTLMVRWPSGGTDTLTSVNADQYMQLVEKNITAISVKAPTPHCQLMLVSPNPFHDRCAINIKNIASRNVLFRIVDIRGKLVLIRRINTAQQGNSHSLWWDGRCENGVEVVPGLYFASITLINENSSQKNTFFQKMRIVKY